MSQDGARPDDSNVIDLDEKCKADIGKELPKGKGGRPLLIDIYAVMVSILDGKTPHCAPRRKLIASHINGGPKQALEVKDGIASILTKDILVEDIVILSKSIGWHLTVKQAKEAADQWLCETEAHPEPRAVSFANDPRLCFSRLPWPYKEGPCPLFEEMLSRMSDPDAVIDWIGSLFDPNADRHQYLWIFGEGQNGKSALARFLRRVFGHAYTGVQPPRKDDAHWSTCLLGKRLVCFPDCNNYGFPASGYFKTLTGGDGVQMNKKFGDIYSAELTCKFLFLSNDHPALSSETADLRRAIYVEMKPIPGAVDPHYEDRLWQEGGAFLTACIQGYRAHNPEGGPIRTNLTHLQQIVQEEEEPFLVAFEKNFTLGPSRRLLARELQEVLARCFPDRHRAREFRAWMKRKGYLGGSKVFRMGETTHKGYEGLGISHEFGGDHVTGL